MSQKTIDALFSSLLFFFVNAGGVYLLIESESLMDFKYPLILIACYIFLYAISVISFFGYRVRQINNSVKLSTPIGMKVILNFNEITSMKSYLRIVYLLKCNRRMYLLWNHLGNAEKLGELIQKRSEW